MNTLIDPKTATVAAKLAKAKAKYGSIRQVEGTLRLNHKALLVLAFELGQLLTELKEEIGHGNWMLWLPGNFSELGDDDDKRIKNAQRCMNFHRDNISNSQNSENLKRRAEDFSTDSVRKFMWGYIPAKERPQLEGDESVSAKPHYLSFVNHFVKWDRQLSLGHVSMPSVTQFRKEMENVQRRIIAIAGWDWVQSLSE
jgi:hypothetical protein